MKIVIYEKERKTLASFADEYGLTMEIHERTPSDLGAQWNQNSRYYAHFEACDVKDGVVLCGTYGNGSSPDEAMADYAEQISGQLLVFNAWTNKLARREIVAPFLTHSTNEADKEAMEKKLAFWGNSSNEWRQAYVALGGTASESGTEELTKREAAARQQGFEEGIKYEQRL